MGLKTLVYDGNHFLATRLLSAASAKQNMEAKLVNRVSTPTAAIIEVSTGRLQQFACDLFCILRYTICQCN